MPKRGQTSAPRGRFGLATVGTAVAIVTSVVALVLTLVERNERLKVDLAVTAKANIRDYSFEGFGLRLAVVNLGERELTIDRAALVLGKHVVGRADGLLEDPRLLDKRLIDPAGVTDNRLDLPITIPGRESRNLVLLFADVRSPNLPPYLRSYDPSPEGRRRVRLQRAFEQFVSTGKGRQKPKVVLGVAGEDSREYSVRRLPAMTFRFEWQYSLVGRGKRAVGVSVRRKLAVPGQSDVLRMDLWGERSRRLRRTVTRPIIDDSPTEYSFGVLPKGRYVFVVRHGSQTVVGGRFRVPEPCARDGYIPELPSSSQEADNELRERDPAPLAKPPFSDGCRQPIP